MVDFTDRKQLEKWLAGKPREVCVAIAARAALRVLPLAAEAIPPRSGKRRQATFEVLTKAIFRAT